MKKEDTMKNQDPHAEGCVAGRQDNQTSKTMNHYEAVELFDALTRECYYGHVFRAELMKQSDDFIIQLQKFVADCKQERVKI